MNDRTVHSESSPLLRSPSYNVPEKLGLGHTWRRIRHRFSHDLIAAIGRGLQVAFGSDGALFLGAETAELYDALLRDDVRIRFHLVSEPAVFDQEDVWIQLCTKLKVRVIPGSLEPPSESFFFTFRSRMSLTENVTHLQQFLREIAEKSGQQSERLSPNLSHATVSAPPLVH